MKSAWLLPVVLVHPTPVHTMISLVFSWQQAGTINVDKSYFRNNLMYLAAFYWSASSFLSNCEETVYSWLMAYLSSYRCQSVWRSCCPVSTWVAMPLCLQLGDVCLAEVDGAGCRRPRWRSSDVRRLRRTESSTYLQQQASANDNDRRHKAVGDSSFAPGLSHTEHSTFYVTTACCKLWRAVSGVTDKLSADEHCWRHCGIAPPAHRRQRESSRRMNTTFRR